MLSVFIPAVVLVPALASMLIFIMSMITWMELAHGSMLHKMKLAGEGGIDPRYATKLTIYHVNQVCQLSFSFLFTRNNRMMGYLCEIFGASIFLIFSDLDVT